MLITLKEMMDIAEERQIAVGSFNTPNLESLLSFRQRMSCSCR